MVINGNQMVIKRRCAFRFATGEACRMAPLKEGEFCWAHSPEHAQEAQEARRLGGLRRKREATLSGAYDLEGLGTVNDIQRMVEIAGLDTLGMENSLARNRTLLYAASTALKALEVGEVAERLAALEQAVRGRRIDQEPAIFDMDAELLEGGDKEKK